MSEEQDKQLEKRVLALTQEGKARGVIAEEVQASVYRVWRIQKAAGLVKTRKGKE